MRRHLFGICLCLVMLAALRHGAGAPPDASRLLWGGMAGEGGTVTVTGRAYQKTHQTFCIDSVVIQQSSGHHRQEIPISDLIVCECDNAEDVRLGGNVQVTGTPGLFSAASNPGEFDFCSYYRTQGIGGRLTGVTWVAQGEEYSLFRESMYRLKEYWKQRLYRVFPQKEASVLAAMLLGDKEGLDEEIRGLYQRNGVVHILSISGLHITLIGMGVYKLLRRAGCPVWPAAALGGGILLGYGMLTGMSISAVRAIGMYLLRMLAAALGRTYDMLTALGLMAAVMLWRNPLYLEHAGFLLSFASVLGMGTIYPVLAKGKRYRGFGGGLCKSLAAGTSVTLATLPVQLWFYYEVPTLSVFLNLLVLPFMGIVVVTGLGAMLVPGLGILGTAANLVLWWYEKLCGLFDRIPFQTWNPGRPSLAGTAVYYGLLAGVLVWRHLEREREDVPASFRRPFRAADRAGAWGKACVRGLFVAMGIAALGFQPREDGVTFLDVGQGDCIFLETASGEHYLYDCGSVSRRGVGESVLLPFLKFKGVHKLDGVFLSHSDEDHCSGILELLEAAPEEGIGIDRLVLADLSEDLRQQEYGEILEAAWENGKHAPVEVSYLGKGECMKSGALSFLCLHPPEGYLPESANAGSLCLYVEYGGREDFSLLLTGDVEEEGEELLLRELADKGIGKVTVLKTAHHGSRNSTTEEFLGQVAPQAAVISCGRGNRYGHPHEELLERLQSEDIRIFRTDGGGAVTVHIGEGGIRVETFLK